MRGDCNGKDEELFVGNFCMPGYGKF